LAARAPVIFPNNSREAGQEGKIGRLERKKLATVSVSWLLSSLASTHRRQGEKWLRLKLKVAKRRGRKGKNPRNHLSVVRLAGTYLVQLLLEGGSAKALEKKPKIRRGWEDAKRRGLRRTGGTRFSARSVVIGGSCLPDSRMHQWGTKHSPKEGRGKGKKKKGEKQVEGWAGWLLPSPYPRGLQSNR